MPFIVVGLLGIHRHYEHVARSLRSTHLDPKRNASNRFVFLVRDLGPATTDALVYLRALRPRDIVAVYVGEPSRFDETARAWLGVAPRFGPLQPLPTDSKGPIRGVRHFLRTIDREGIDFVTVVVPESVSGVSWLAFATRQRPAFLLKASLLFTPDVVVTDVPLVPEEVEEAERRAARPTEPARHVVLVPISAVHDGTVQAIVYAKTLHATHVEALCIAADPEGTPGIVEAWWDSGIDIPLSLVEAPFREFGPPLLEEVRTHTARTDTIVTVVLPELLVTRWWEHLLHGQTALFFKRILLGEPHVVVTSVPYRLRSTRDRRLPALSPAMTSAPRGVRRRRRGADRSLRS